MPPERQQQSNGRITDNEEEKSGDYHDEETGADWIWPVHQKKAVAIGQALLPPAASAVLPPAVEGNDDSDTPESTGLPIFTLLKIVGKDAARVLESAQLYLSR